MFTKQDPNGKIPDGFVTKSPTGKEARVLGFMSDAKGELVKVNL